MKINYIQASIYLLCLLGCVFLSCTNNNHNKVEHETKNINAVDAIKMLKEGNIRFLKQESIKHNYIQEIEDSKQHQTPFALVLSCMDSRVPPEIIFDQGIGNIFVLRNAGNIEENNDLGSIEYAVKYNNVPLILVLGHTHCGAVKGAVRSLEHEHLTQLQIQPNIPKNKDSISNNHGLSRYDEDFNAIVEETVIKNIVTTINDLKQNSKTINEAIQQNKLQIRGALYDIETGKVQFM